MTDRRAFITSGLGLAGIIAAGRAPAALVRSAIAARQVAFGKNKPTAKDYVQDGLVFLMDAIENGGYGVHNVAGTWKDLISGSSYSISNYSGYEWSDKAFTSDNNHQFLMAIVPVHLNATMEVCISNCNYEKSQRNYNFGPFSCYPLPAQTYGAFGIVWDKKSRFQMGKVVPWNYNINGRSIYREPFQELTTLTDAANISNGIGLCYVNGDLVKTQSENNTTIDLSHSTHLMRTNTGECMAASYHCFRMYSRVISEEEVLHNYAIDRARFGLT